jgi:hypothetical protein
MFARFGWLLILLGWLPCVCGGEPAPERGHKPSKSARFAELTAEQEQQALEFLRQHNPELADLIGHLQVAAPKEYQRALRDVGRVRERLSQVQKGDPDHYDLELKAWVLQSRIHLAVARLAMNDSPQLRAELRDLVAQQADLKLAMLHAERDRQAERLKKLDDQIQRLQDQRTEFVEKQLQSLTKSSQNLAPRAKTARPKPAPASPVAAPR